MRLIALGLVAVLMLAIVFALFVLQGRQALPIAALVPEDFRFGLFYSSVNDLRNLYVARDAQRDLDPARPRIGLRINVPELDGVSYREPVGSYYVGDEEVLLVPFRDFSAFERAFASSRENLRLQQPRRVAANYLSLSASGRTAEAGALNALVARATEYPASLAGQPRDAADVRLMLTYLFLYEGARQRVAAPLIAQEIARLPESVCALIAEQCEDLVVGIRGSLPPHFAARLSVEAAPHAGSPLERAAAVAGRLELSDLVRALPRGAVLFAGAVLDRAGWARVGLPLPLGEGAFLFAIVDADAAFATDTPEGRRIHERRHTLLLLARPADTGATEDLERWGVAFFLGAAGTEFETLEDGAAVVRTAPLPRPPDWLGNVLATSAREPPPVRLSMAAENGLWICAVGSQARETVQVALGCSRGAEELSIAGREVGATGVQPVHAHEGFLGRGHVALALVSAEGLQALRQPMPYLQLASVGQPGAVTFHLDVADRARAEMRLFR